MPVVYAVRDKFYRRSRGISLKMLGFSPGVAAGTNARIKTGKGDLGISVIFLRVDRKGDLRQIGQQEEKKIWRMRGVGDEEEKGVDEGVKLKRRRGREKNAREERR